jgi:hypothetical protein
MRDSQKEGVPLTDDPREATIERELQRELQRERALLASVPSPAKVEKTEQHRKRRRRDSSLLASSAPSLATPGGDVLRGNASRPPGPVSKRPKTIVKLTHGQVYALTTLKSAAALARTSVTCRRPVT